MYYILNAFGHVTIYMYLIIHFAQDIVGIVTVRTCNRLNFSGSRHRAYDINHDDAIWVPK